MGSIPTASTNPVSSSCRQALDGQRVMHVPSSVLDDRVPRMEEMSNPLCPLCRRPIRAAEPVASTAAHLRCYVRALQRERAMTAGPQRRTMQAGSCDAATTESCRQARPVCAVCGKPIEPGDGRLRSGPASIHLACRDALRMPADAA